MTYRIMNQDDIEKVIPLYIEYYNEHDGDEWTEESVRHRIRQVLGSPDAYCLMALEGTEAVGFAMGRFERFYDLTAYDLVEIIIGTRYQSQGRGTALMRELEQRVREKGAAMIQLIAVNDDAHDRFYGRLDYKNAGNLVLKSKFL